MAILLFVNQCSMIVISLIFVQKSEHAHSTAPPLQTRPSALGSGLGLTVHEMACASFSATKGRIFSPELTEFRAFLLPDSLYSGVLRVKCENRSNRQTWRRLAAMWLA